MEQMIFSWRFAKRLAYLAAATMVFGGVLSLVLTHAAPDNSPAWATPSVMTIRRVTGVTVAQSEPVFLNNLECTPLTYRQAATSTMQSGCFTEAAFGLMDTDSGAVIFNGTDEGLPLLPHTPHQIPVPWPHALDLIGLDPADNGGVQISLYKNPLAALQDQRNLLAQVTAKRLDRPPDITLKDATGRPLVINPQTIAFSENGAWLVTETLGGSFIRINLATLSMKAFARAYGSEGSPALLKSRVTITDDGRFAAIANDIAGTFKVYNLSTCDQDCRAHDYRASARQQIGGLQSVRHLRFVNEGLLSFDAITTNPSDTGTYELAPVASITSLTDYIGLGDSYTSGEGAFDYLSDTDTEDNVCHVSRNSYPLLLTHDLFTASGGHSVACSGAVIKDVGSTSNSYRGQVRGVPDFQQLQASQPLLLEAVQADFLPGYVAQQRFVQRWQPRIATVSIGGNDVGFSDLVQNCVEPHISRHVSDNTCYNTYEDRLELSRLVDRTVPKWTGLYKQLRREAPDMRLYAVGYPQLVTDTGDCALNVQLNKSELEFAESIVDYLNQDIRKAAAGASVPYIDISHALDGHRLCETASYNVAVNGLTAGTDGGFGSVKVFGHESFHPNALGQQLIEQAILKQTHNFAFTTPDNPPASAVDAGTALLNAPVSGRQINILIPDNNLTTGAGKRGAAIAVMASGDDGLRASETYVVHLDGPGGIVLGAITSNEDGNLQGSATIPIDTVPGGHTINVTGPNQAGEPINITQSLYVLASDADSDGDGFDDITDSCPGALNSRQDSDRNGVDDICDSLVAYPPAGPGHSLVGLPQSSVAAPQILGSTTFDRGLHSLRSAVKHNKGLSSNMIYWLPILCLAVILGMKIYIQKIKYRLQWVHMNRFRKGLVYLLSLFLLATLVGTALSTSTNQTLGKPKKVEQYLSESKLYDHFIAYTSDQAKKTNGDTDTSGSVSLSDAAVQQAAQSAFPPKLIEQSINTFIDSNYAWLEGKTDKPEFKIDLSAQKQTFAEKVGQYVKTYTATLPVCANPQIAQQQSGDPLAATCRPAELTPEAAGAQVTQRLTTTGDFLSDPVITANSVNPKGNQQSKPYYDKLSHLPKLYQFGQKMPWVLGVLSLLFALAVVFTSLERRKGVRKVGIVLLIAGLSLVALKFFSDLAFRRAEHHIFNSADVGQLQQSLTNFAHRLETGMVRIDLWFGIAFLLLATAIFIALAATRQKDGSKATGSADTPPAEGAGGKDDKAPLILSRKRLQRPVKDLTPRARPADAGTAPELPEEPKPKKPRRLIQ